MATVDPMANRLKELRAMYDAQGKLDLSQIPEEELAAIRSTLEQQRRARQVQAGGGSRVAGGTAAAQQEMFGPRGGISRATGAPDPRRIPPAPTDQMGLGLRNQPAPPAPPAGETINLTPEEIAAARTRTNAAFAEPESAAVARGDTAQAPFEKGSRSVITPPAEQKPGIIQRVKQGLSRTPQPGVPAYGGDEMEIPERPGLNAVQRNQLGSARDMTAEAMSRKQSLQRQIAQVESGPSNPKRLEGLRAALESANADIAAGRQLEQEVLTAPRTKKSVVETANEAFKDPKKATYEAGKATEQVVREGAAKAKEAAGDVMGAAREKVAQVMEEAPKTAKEIKQQTKAAVKELKKAQKAAIAEARKTAPGVVEKGKKFMNKVAEVAKSPLRGSINAEDLPGNAATPAKAQAATRIRNGVNTMGKGLGGVGAVDFLWTFGLQLDKNDGDFGRTVAEFTDVIANGVKNAQDYMADAESGLDFAGRTAKVVAKDFIWDGLVMGSIAAIPSLAKKLYNFEADTIEGLGFDMGGYRFDVDADPWSAEMLTGGRWYQEQQAQAAGGTGVQAAPATTPVATEAAAAPEPVSRLGLDGSINLALPEDQQRSRLDVTERGNGMFGLRGANGGVGVLDATNAAGGPQGFQNRVQQSMREGAYNPVTAERQREAQMDNLRVNRGLNAMRDLSATRMGVPVQYLDAVRSGQMSRREASMLGARDAGIAAENAPAMAKAQADAARGLREAGNERIDRGTKALDRIADNYGNLTNPENPIRGSEEIRDFASYWVGDANLGNMDATRLQDIPAELELRKAIKSDATGILNSIFGEDTSIAGMTRPGESVLQTLVNQDGRRQWFWDEDNMKFTITNDDGSQETVSLDVNDDMRPKVSLYIARALGQLQQ